MLIAVIGENCVGKSTLVNKLNQKLKAKVYSGKDYLRLEKNSALALSTFKTILNNSVKGDNIMGSEISLIIMIGLFVLMYFFMMRPQKKREKELQQLRNNLEVGDIVVTEAGIVGKVISAKDYETVIIETGSDKTRIRFKRWAIVGKEKEQ